MAYHGYVQICKQYIDSLQHVPAILEVGTDKGITFIPLAAHLANTKTQFTMMGIDVMVQDSLSITLNGLGLKKDQQIFLIEGNSLEVIPKLVDQSIKFDLVLIDGDHNYHTVNKELESLESITHPHSLVIIDDYDGRWSSTDMWYAKRPGYKDNKIATKPIKGKKHGVKAAVDEFLKAKPEWKSYKPIPGEPIVLVKSAA